MLQLPQTAKIQEKFKVTSQVYTAIAILLMLLLWTSLIYWVILSVLNLTTHINLLGECQAILFEFL